MKDFIKNNIFISFAIGLMWVFFLCLSISESGFFAEYFMQALAITMFWVVMSSFKTRQIEKIKRAKENISSKEVENATINKKNNGKLNYKKASRVSLSFLAILFGSATIFTVMIIYIRHMDFKTYFFSGIIFFSAVELVVGSIITFAIEYIKDCKKDGFLKTTLYVIFMLIVAACLVYNKN